MQPDQGDLCSVTWCYSTDSLVPQTLNVCFVLFHLTMLAVVDVKYVVLVFV